MPPRIMCPAPRSVGGSSQRLAHRYISPRISQPSSSLRPVATPSVWMESTASAWLSGSRGYATAVTMVNGRLQLPADYIPPTQPPSARRPEVRKSQLLRSYTALLRSTPLTLFFQHNNLTSLEWAAIRRELRVALADVPLPAPVEGAPPLPDVVGNIQLQVIRTRIFDRALKIVEFFDAEAATAQASGAAEKLYTHDLSKAAFDAVQAVDIASLPADSQYSQISPLMMGPIALLTFPAVSPAHLSAALSVLAPSPPAFPAPTRKKRPGWHDPLTQAALHKLLLVGGRVEDRIFDLDGVKWVGGIPGGRDGLRAQLVAMLQSAGMGLTSALEGAGKSLWLTMESRRTVLEDEAKDPEEKEEKPAE